MDNHFDFDTHVSGEDTAAFPAQEMPVYAQPQQPAHTQPVFTQQTPDQTVYRPVPPPQVNFGYQAAEPKPKKKKGNGMWWKVPVALLLAVAIALGSSAVTAFVLNKQNEGYVDEEIKKLNDDYTNRIKVLKEEIASRPGVQVNPEAPAPEGMSPAEVYSQNVQAVVAIANEGVSTNIYGQTTRTASSGSGFIISADGYVVSNYHVVKDAHALTVMLSDGTEYEAKLIGYDDTNDVSLLKIEAENLPYVTLGSSSDLVVGDQVCAIGNPLGELTSSLTVGYVSAMDRQISTESGAMNMIQTDAAINSGNSGGPLFNTRGQVIGINTAKYSGTSNSGATIEGIGFAIPVDDIKDILEDLKEYGSVQTAYIGVEVRDVDSVVLSYGLPEGAFVQSTVDGLAADKAGIQAQDIIVNFAGHEIGSVSDLLKVLRSVEIGEETTVAVYRAGQTINLKITPEAKPQA